MLKVRNSAYMEPKPAKRRFSSMSSRESIEHQRIADIKDIEVAATPDQKTAEVDLTWFEQFLDEAHRTLPRPPVSPEHTIKITPQSAELLNTWYTGILVQFCVVNGPPIEDTVADPEALLVDVLETIMPGVDPLELYHGYLNSKRISTLDYEDVEPLDPLTTVADLKGRVVIAPVVSTSTVGLSNLGNSCYMNSSLQCLVHVPELAQYFLSGRYADEINQDNPIGYGGAAARAFASLVKSLYTSPNSSFSPIQFKTTMGRFNRSFAGYLQQDSQEFTAFLLDALHEDLNRIKQKPATEKPELPDDKVNDAEAIAQLANAVWDLHKKRNDSVILDLFTGLYKSTLVCPVCDRVSITFDPFGDVTLPFPNLTSWVHTIYFFGLDGTQKQFQVALQAHSSISQLKAQVREVTETTADLEVGEVYSNKIWQWYSDNDTVGEKIGADDSIAVYEKGKRSLTVLTQHNQAYFSPPFMLEVEESDTLEQVRTKLQQYYAKSDAGPFKIGKVSRNSPSDQTYMHRITPLEPEESDTGSDPELSSPASHSEPFEMIPTPSPEPTLEPASEPSPVQPLFGEFDMIVCEFEAEFLNKDYEKVENPIATEVQQRLKSQKSLTLDDCFDIFSTPEVLGENDLWYCSNCKDFRQATKQIELWECPEIFTIHLKRFRDIHSSRDKINDVVDFPIECLDMTKRVLGGANGKEEYIYDLIAVDNHFGGLGGGHYTAFAKSPISGQWYYYNDSNVTSADPIDSVTGAAYLLFYRRRHPRDESAFEDVMKTVVHQQRLDMREKVAERCNAAKSRSLTETGMASRFEGQGQRLGGSDASQSHWGNATSFLDKQDDSVSDMSS